MRILCLDIPAPGASLEKYAPHLNAEALHAWGLYKSGFIRDIYFRQDRPGVAIFLECDSVDEAMNVMAEFSAAPGNNTCVIRAERCRLQRSFLCRWSWDHVGFP